MAKPLDLMNDDLLYLGGRAGSQKWRLTGELISHPTVEFNWSKEACKENYQGKIETDLGLISE